jgi:hypothetical protein
MARKMLIKLHNKESRVREDSEMGNIEEKVPSKFIV